MDITLTAVIVMAHLWIVEEDNKKWNHCFHAVDNDGRDLLISYTGDTALGKENEKFPIRFDKLECSQVVPPGHRRESRRYPSGGFLCNAEGADRQYVRGDY